MKENFAFEENFTRGRTYISNLVSSASHQLKFIRLIFIIIKFSGRMHGDMNDLLKSEAVEAIDEVRFLYLLL